MKPKAGFQIGNNKKSGSDDRIGYAGLALAGLVALLVMALFLDEPISRAWQQWPAHERAFFEWLTRWGEADWILVPALVVAVIAFLVRGLHLAYRTRWSVTALGGLGWYIFIGVGAPGLTAAILKRLIGRARPIHMEELGSLSFQPVTFDWTLGGFPSGHATTAFAFAVIMASLFPRRWAWVFFTFAVLVAISRIAVGMHYPTDVIVGAILGAVGAVLVRNWFAGRRFPVTWRDGRIHNRAAVPLKRSWRRVAAG